MNMQNEVHQLSIHLCELRRGTQDLSWQAIKGTSVSLAAPVDVVLLTFEHCAGSCAVGARTLNCILNRSHTNIRILRVLTGQVVCCKRSQAFRNWAERRNRT